MEKFGVYQLSTVFKPRLRDKADTPREAREKMERLSWENRSGMFIIKPLLLMDDVFKRQDEFLARMIEMWKQDKRLKPFDLYFRWKTGELSTGEWREQKDAIRQMRVERDRLMESLWDENNPANEELELVVEAIDNELINIQQIIGL